MRFGPSQPSCLGTCTCTCSSAGRALYPECRVSWVRIQSEVIFHYKKSDCLGCAVLVSFVCLTLLASSFYFLSLTCTHVYMYMYTCTCTCIYDMLHKSSLPVPVLLPVLWGLQQLPKVHTLSHLRVTEPPS